MNLRIKRILSSLIDFCIMLGLFFFLSYIYSLIFVQNNEKYQNYASEANQILLDSGLFKEEKGELVEIDTLIDDKLNSFYKMTYNEKDTYPYIDNTDKYVSYNDAKEKSGLFHQISNGSYVPNEGKTDEEFASFYKKELYKAEISLYNYSNYKNLKQYIDHINKIGGYTNIVVSNVLVYLIMPFILKDKTLGEKIFKLKLVSQDNNKASIVQHFVRFIAWFMIDILMSTWLFFIPITINMIIFLIDKKSRGIADLLAVTMVIEEEQ